MKFVRKLIEFNFFTVFWLIICVVITLSIGFSAALKLCGILYFIDKSFLIAKTLYDLILIAERENRIERPLRFMMLKYLNSTAKYFKQMEKEGLPYTIPGLVAFFDKFG